MRRCEGGFEEAVWIRLEWKITVLCVLDGNCNLIDQFLVWLPILSFEHVVIEVCHSITDRIEVDVHGLKRLILSFQAQVSL